MTVQWEQGSSARIQQLGRRKVPHTNTAGKLPILGPRPRWREATSQPGGMRERGSLMATPARGAGHWAAGDGRLVAVPWEPGPALGTAARPTALTPSWQAGDGSGQPDQPFALSLGKSPICSLHCSPGAAQNNAGLYNRGQAAGSRQGRHMGPTEAPQPILVGWCCCWPPRAAPAVLRAGAGGPWWRGPFAIESFLLGTLQGQPL